jgi:hypothetical protein
MKGRCFRYAAMMKVKISNESLSRRSGLHPKGAELPASAPPRMTGNTQRGLESAAGGNGLAKNLGDQLPGVLRPPE